MKRFVIGALIFVIIFVPLLEGLLWAFDPAGIAMFNDFDITNQHLEGDYLFYFLPAGSYHLRRWNLTILNDHTRRVPDTNSSAPCTIVAIGDSVTLGWGVNDNETWVNLLATEFPEVHFVNAGMYGYSSRHVMISQSQWVDQADGMIYFINANDVEDGTPQPRHEITMGSYLGTYLVYAVTQPRSLDTEYTHFWFDLEVIFSHENTVVFIDDPLLAFQIERRLPGVVNFIPSHNTRVSAVDSHPNAAGHQRIASAMRLQIEQAIESWCD